MKFLGKFGFSNSDLFKPFDKTLEQGRNTCHGSLSLTLKMF